MFTVISVLSCTLLLTACSSNSQQQSGVASSVKSSSEEVSDVGNPFEIPSDDVPSSLPSEELSDAGNPFEIPSDDVSSSLSSEEISSDTSEVGETLTYKDFEYQKGNDEENGVTITKYIGNDANVSIPEKIYGTDVTILGDSAFKDNTSIQSVTIPDTVTDIMNSAFYGCKNLEKVKLEDTSNLATINDDAFYLTAMTEFTVPKNCEVVYDAFGNTLKKLYVLGKKTEFGKNVLSAATTVYGYKDSQAAKELSPLHGYKFESLDDVSE